MKILKPKWVTHENNLPIFSIDIHPDGSRFATGGQGADSGKVVIWNMAPVVSRKAESDENVPKMLCQMDNHEACVNCVRWSHCGRFLASGGDDKLIMVWKVNQLSGGNTVFGSGGGIVNVESWRCSSTLRGHHGDVLDLAWSSNDAWLASCSIDNTVIVWNAVKFPEMVAVLKGHTGLVKGVAWDPVGKYLASQSEDRTLRVWRTVDWKEEQVIRKPFEKCSGSTHVLRLSWSPDGQHLVSAHAMNGPGPTAQIIEREGWKHETDFVGHRKPVTCVRFSDVLFRRSNMKQSQHYTCCVIGSRDQALSIWLTYLKRPLTVIRELFSNSVLDASWSSKGTQLMACSWDGTVAYVELSEEELGKALSKEDKISLHEKKYGKSLLSQNSTFVSRVVETPELLKIQEKTVLQGTTSSGSSASGEDRRATSTIKGPINKQIETRTSDGRRRITPMFIPPTPDRGEAPQPFSSNVTSQPTFSSAESRSRIVVEKREDVIKPNVASAKSSVKDTLVVVNGYTTVEKTKTPDVTPEKANAVPTPFAPASFGGKRRLEREKDKSATTTQPVASGISGQISQTNASGAKRARFNLERPAVTSIQPSHSASDTGPLTGRVDIPGLILPVLKPSNRFTVQVNMSKSQWVEVDNAYTSTTHGPLSKVRVLKGFSAPCSAFGDDSSKGFSVTWETIFGSPVIGVVANSVVVCVACEDGTLNILDCSCGGRKLPPVVLNTPASRLSLNSHSHLMVVTACGSLSVWDLIKSRKLISNESLLPIMSGNSGSQVTILSCTLSDKGIPMLSLSTGRAFVFSDDMGCWLQVGNSRNPVSRNSLYHSFLSQPVTDGAALPLTCLQADIRSCGSGSRQYGAVNAGATSSVVQPCSLAFLDEQLAACRAVESPREYQNWLLTNTRFLVQHGLEDRLRQICDYLLGPTHKTSSPNSSWEKTVMGLSKHSILKEVLNIMSQNLRWQRLWTEYSEQLQTMLEENNSTV